MSLNLLAKSARKSGLVLISAVLVYGMVVPALFTSFVHAAPANLIANPLVETPDPSNANSPADWQVGSWGTNTFTSSYLTSGPTGDTNSVEINMTAYTSGDAKWYFNPVNVTAGDQYTFTDEYESNVPTDLSAEFLSSSGAASYEDLGDQIASTTWNQATSTFTVPAGTVSMSLFHLISNVGTLTTGDFSLIPSSTPTVSVTNPTANGVVSGSSVALAANATDADGVTNVQFQVNGNNVGNPITSSPYTYDWDSMTVTNGMYNITAVATNIDGVTSTSAAVAVNVDNKVPLGTNLIANPLVETPDPSNANSPADWQVGSWGTNTFTSSYLTSGPTGDTNSVEINMTAYTSGDAKWYFNPVNVTAGTEYTFSDSYKSTAASDVSVAYTMSDGTDEYVDLGTLPASASWQTFSASFVAPAGAVSASIYHVINSVGTLTTSMFSLAASTSPTVAITAPAASTATSTPYSGTVNLEASATDNTGIASVQFQIDGSNVGAPITTAPYEYSWDSTSVTNGTHSVTAVVTNSNNQTTTSVPVSIEVSNTVSAGGNIVPNPLMNIASTTTPNTPQDWTLDSWGTNTFTSSYQNTGSAGDSHSAEINMTKYTSGDAKWTFTPQIVAQDTQYQYSEYYESNVQTLVNAVFTMSDGTTEYQIIALPYVANTWTEFTTKFSVPAGAQTITIYHLIENVGTLSIDNASLTTYVPVGFSSPIVTLTFDDGYETEYTNALPILEQYGFTSTQFDITDQIGDSGYMTAAQLKTLYQDGDEIASHTVTHDDLTQETTAQLSNEMTESKTTLQTDTGEPTTDMAYPYGLYNANVMSSVEGNYSAARGVESGLNSKDNFNQYDLKVEDVYTTTTTAQISDWVAQAQATDTWLIFVYHGVDTDVNNAVDGDIYDVPPAQLSEQMAAIKASGVTVENLNQALASVDAQMGITSTNNTVMFNANGGTGTMTGETASKATALTANKYTRTGYTFTGWNTAAAGTGTSYANSASYPFTSSTTLYAQWKANAASYTVTFNANGGTGTMASESASVATALTANKYTRTGYTFTGWNTAVNGTGTAYANDATYPFTASTTLYAQWKANAVSYTVTFNANGGTGTMTAETENTATPLTANKYTRTGYTFTGWNTEANGNGTTYANSASYPFTGSTTLYAQWKANVSYTVTFNANGGTGTMTAETASSATALTANKYTRTGYSFSGWNTSTSGTGTAYANGATYQFTASTTLYAQWKKI